MTTPDFTSNSQVLDALNKASELLAGARRERTEPIAVIGMACRFPGAPDLDAFAQLLRDGRSAISSVAADRWDAASLTSPDPKTPGKVITDRAGFIDDVDQFDTRFFEISRREASSLDPQQRLLLETSLRALEHAGIPPSQMYGQRGGVFVGMCSSDYLALLNREPLDSVDAYHGTGNAHGAAAGRLSYFLKWEGPSLAIDTACSSSLVATHNAIQSLRGGDCEMALVAGVNVILTPELSINLSQAGMLSPQGLCQAFAAGADGFVRGEGCGVILLKKLSRAQADGDRILCCLSGSAVNQDGRSNGLTAPNGMAQQDVIREALRRSGLEPSDIDYIEAHGTGTELGDPIEARALGQVFGDRSEPLRIGSVKTNIGHLEGAAGIAGLIKTCLAIRDEHLPQHLHFEEPSEHIDWTLPIEVTADGSPWPRREGLIRRAGVSSFGFGGTNAHVIVSEHLAPASRSYSTLDRPAQYGDWHLLKLSAKSEVALTQLHADMAQSLPEAELSEIAAAANLGRDDYEHRAFVIARSRDELIGQLQASETSASVDDSHRAALQQIGERYVAGESIDWTTVCSGDRTKLVDLPGHPFLRQRCWLKGSDSNNPAVATVSRSESLHPLIGSQLDIGGETLIFEADLAEIAYLNDHRLHGEAVFPATGYIEQALSAAWSLTGKAMTITSAQFERALTICGGECRVQVHLRPVDSGYECSIMRREAIRWQKHATLQLARARSIDEDTAIWQASDLQPRCTDKHYVTFDGAGIQYGPAFQGLVGITASDAVVQSVVELPIDAGDARGYRLHPALLDACMQSLAALFPDGDDCMWLPVAIDELRYVSTNASPTKAYVAGSIDRRDDETIVGSLQVRGADGTPIAEVRGLRVKRVAAGGEHLTVVSDQSDDEIEAIRSRLCEADAGARFDLVTEFAQRKVAQIAELDLDEVQLDTPLTSLGLDSIMAVELQAVLEKLIGSEVSMELFLRDLSLREVLQELLDSGDASDMPVADGSLDDDLVEGAL